MLSLVAPGIGDQKFTSQQAHYGQFTIALVFFFGSSSTYGLSEHRVPANLMVNGHFRHQHGHLMGIPSFQPYSTLWLPCPFLYCMYHLSQRKHTHPLRGGPRATEIFQAAPPPFRFSTQCAHQLAGSRTSLDAAGCSCKLGINRKTIPVGI